ncbi:hypothetical protein EAI_11512 [Harpegnathos saltator]|uniref:Uncharacterized protein n=1 Tax=Harpegnathos saltator TaxID=610380 RepID=E2C3G4_HARSA|nr:hypothetical protein EAI_11512 [Harpegnathos saltator]
MSQGVIHHSLQLAQFATLSFLANKSANFEKEIWFLAVMPSSEEESQWLVGSGGGGLAPSGGSATKTGGGERILNTRTGLYTEEMTTQPASVTTAGVNSASADSAEHDLIDSTADATLLAQFHEDAIKQVMP